MKQGLLLKDAPEPLIKLDCWSCKISFVDVYQYLKHRKEIHKQIYSYKKYVYNHRGFEEIAYHKQWMSLDEYEGRICPHPDYIPKRPVKRFNVTFEELANRDNKKCHCGKDPVKPRRKYCSDECAESWYDKIATSNYIVSSFLKDKKIRKETHQNGWDIKYFFRCEACNNETTKPEVDHIIAIVLGGHPWDFRNLQILCSKCHKKKQHQTSRF